ncbi:MAG TPA: hypothetical protein VFG90_01865 [Nitrososphaeraceae archaeon]|nr:hypothetical protein [Nitrososphaeraceae archaeon]
MKTTLDDIIIDDDKEIAKKRVQQITRMREEQIREFAIYGTPEDCIKTNKVT